MNLVHDNVVPVLIQDQVFPVSWLTFHTMKSWSPSTDRKYSRDREGVAPKGNESDFKKKKKEW